MGADDNLARQGYLEAQADMALVKAEQAAAGYRRADGNLAARGYLQAQADLALAKAGMAAIAAGRVAMWFPVGFTSLQQARALMSERQQAALDAYDLEAIRMIVAERVRQVTVEGHDLRGDAERRRELAKGAGAYLLSATGDYFAADVQVIWPFAPFRFKPKDHRSDTVRGAALATASLAALLRKQAAGAEAEAVDPPSPLV